MTEQQKQDINVYDISLKLGNLDNNEENNLILSCKINYNQQEIPITIQFNVKKDNNTIVFHHIKIKINAQEFSIKDYYYDSTKNVQITLLSLMGCYKDTRNINFSLVSCFNNKNDIEEIFSKGVSLEEQRLVLLTFLKDCLEMLKPSNNNNTITNIYDSIKNIDYPLLDNENIERKEILAATDFIKAINSFKQNYVHKENTVDDISTFNWLCNEICCCKNNIGCTNGIRSTIIGSVQ